MPIIKTSILYSLNTVSDDDEENSRDMTVAKSLNTVSKDDEENSREMPVAKSGDGMMNMICMQGFRGNWTLSTDVCKALKVDIKVLKGLNISKVYLLTVFGN